MEPLEEVKRKQIKWGVDQSEQLKETEKGKLGARGIKSDISTKLTTKITDLFSRITDLFKK